MSRNMTDEELEASAAESARVNSCEHEKCHPYTWHWDGKVKEMYCPDCRQTNWLE